MSGASSNAWERSTVSSPRVASVDDAGGGLTGTTGQHNNFTPVLAGQNPDEARG